VPPPGIAATATTAPAEQKKSHIKKPEDFTKAKQWDHFQRQAFIYLEENKRDFDSDQQVIHFLISFMTEGLPEKSLPTTLTIFWTT
jgi:hypothetical protein